MPYRGPAIGKYNATHAKRKWHGKAAWSPWLQSTAMGADGQVTLTDQMKVGMRTRVHTHMGTLQRTVGIAG